MKPTLAALLIPLVFGCSGGGRRDPSSPAGVAAADPAAAQVALDPGWGDEEGRSAAHKLVGSCLVGAWPERLAQRHRRSPVLALERVANRSSEHVNLQSITRQLRAALAAGARGRITLAGEGQPGDLSLLGRLSSQDDRTTSTTLKALLLSLSIVDNSSAEVLWADSYLVRKLISRAPPAREGAPPGPPKVQRLAPDQTVDVSGVFNDYNASALAGAAVQDLLASGWLKGGAAPVVRIAPLRNRTAEQISGDFITGPLLRALVRHRGARVVRPADQARSLRARRLLAAGDAGPSLGQELAPTHLLSLQLSAETQARRGISFTRYTLSASVVSVDDSRTVWSFGRTIQKVLNQAPAEATVR